MINQWLRHKSSNSLLNSFKVCLFKSYTAVSCIFMYRPSMIIVSGSKTTYTTGEWSCLISFAWASPSWEESEAGEKFKMKIHHRKSNQLAYPLFLKLALLFPNKKLPISQRLGIITCLPKGDKLRQYIKKNWRPITLLNVFYKIISGCISKRIKSTLYIFIDKTQTGFISGRYIG